MGSRAKLISEYDGKADNLQSFIDALCLVDSVKETHKKISTKLVKTKLKGGVRNTISSETTLQEVIVKLKKSIKGETVDMVTAKLMNNRQ